MNGSTVTLVALTLTLFLWTGLSIARTASTRYLQRVSAAYDEYYQSNRDNEASETTPPVEWDFRKGELVPIPPDEIADSSSAISNRESSPYPAAEQLQVHLVREDEGPFVPLWVLGLAFGKKLARISPLLFHGVFAGITIGLVVIALKLRV